MLGEYLIFVYLFTVYNLRFVWDQRVHWTKGRSWRTNRPYPLVVAACHKIGQGSHVHSLHELNKSVSVSEGYN